MGVLERRVKERELRRAAILDAARKVFLEVGIEQASMDRIATEAELAKGTLYIYFPGKNQLILAIMADHIEQLNALLSDITQSRLSPQNKLIKGVDVFHNFTAENELFYRVMTHVNIREMCECGIAEGAESPDIIRFRMLNSETFTLICSIFQQGIDKGVFKPSLNVQQTVGVFMVALKGSMVVLTNGMLPPDFALPPTRDVLHSLTSILIGGIEQHVSSKPTST